jgi:phosphohistidine phosphatase
MKTLYIVRHAKSSWDFPELGDAERPLMEKGIKNTHLVAGYLKDQKILPGLMISSPAVRALETARIMAKDLGYPEEKIRVEKKVYEGSYDHILDIIYSTPDEIDSLMIFGHNPTFTHLVNLLIHPGIENLPTTGVAAIRFRTDRWESVPSVRPHLDFLITPNKLK